MYSSVIEVPYIFANDYVMIAGQVKTGKTQKAIGTSILDFVTAPDTTLVYVINPEDSPSVLITRILSSLRYMIPEEANEAYKRFGIISPMADESSIKSALEEHRKEHPVFDKILVVLDCPGFRKVQKEVYDYFEQFKLEHPDIPVKFTVVNKLPVQRNSSLR